MELVSDKVDALVAEEADKHEVIWLSYEEAVEQISHPENLFGITAFLVGVAWGMDAVVCRGRCLVSVLKRWGLPAGGCRYRHLRRRAFPRADAQPGKNLRLQDNGPNRAHP